MKKTDKFKIVYIVLSVIGVIFASTWIIIYSVMSNFEAKAVKTEAVIYQITRDTVGNDGDRDVIIKYTFGGREYIKSMSYYHSGMSVGDTVTIFVDPENPDNFQADTKMIFLLVFGSIGGVLILITIIIFTVRSLKKNKNSRLAENGYRVECRGCRIIMNTNVKANGMAAKIIECEWFDTAKKTAMIFQSNRIYDLRSLPDCFSGDADKIIIPVYISRDNDRDYFMDLESSYILD